MDHRLDLVLGGAGAIAWYYAKQFDEWREELVPEGGLRIDPWAGGHHAFHARDSQIFLGGLCPVSWPGIAGYRHCALCGGGPGTVWFAVCGLLPVCSDATWHTQLAVLWIATAWLATGLYVAPLLTGRDPKFQAFGVNFLFISLIVIVVAVSPGSGRRSIDYFGPDANFWFGHQG